jgi:hypothetical protein
MALFDYADLSLLSYTHLRCRPHCYPFNQNLLSSIRICSMAYPAMPGPDLVLRLTRACGCTRERAEAFLQVRYPTYASIRSQAIEHSQG